MHYLFQLGHQPLISAAELEAVLSSLKHENPWPGPQGIKTLKQQNNEYLIINSKKKISAEKLIKQLGGTIKIAQTIPTLTKTHEKNINTQSPNFLITQLSNYLITLFPSSKIEFSLNDSKLAIEIKKELKIHGRSVRYIEPKNTATILHNKLVEKKSDLTIIDGKIFATEAIQPFAEFSERDYGRPGSDNKSGMLPPKLAKIMINLSQAKQDDMILDPFCGSGTILTEAAVMGYTNLNGSDISAKAIADTEKNLKWLISSYHLSSIIYNLYVADSQKLSNNIKPESIDAIITEPCLGQPLHGNESLAALKKQTEELKKLYLNALREFPKILKPNGTVVFIIPRFKYQNAWINIDIQNEIEKIGFTFFPFPVTHSPFLIYHRPNQRLAREIWRFKKIPT